MNIFIVSTVSFEPWDHRNPDTVGIGGSETSAIEMAWRLARRGFNVTSYAPIPDDCPTPHRGVTWKSSKEIDYSQKGLWIIYRAPDQADEFKKNHPGQILWLMCEDIDYCKASNRFTKKRIAKFDRIMPLCEAHALHFMSRYPEMKGKITISSNGIRLGLIRKIEKENIERNPKKIVYASSPDRGLINLIKVFKRAREYDPELQLTVAYGFDNLDKIVKENPNTYWESERNLMGKLLNAPGVTWLGRIPQPQLIREWFSAGMFVYISNFWETNFISIQEAQACGAIPIVSPVWAAAEKLKSGMAIPGNADDPMTRSRFVDAIVRISANASQQEIMRKDMMIYARTHFNYERTVDHWEALINGYEAIVAQGVFQMRYAHGKVLNLGCDIDLCGFGKRGGINIDLNKICPKRGIEMPVDIVADIRNPLPVDNKFDTVILGDVLEHMTDEDAIKTLRNAKKACSGNIVITCPEDYRSRMEQHGHDSHYYADGVSAYHDRPITKNIIDEWLNKAGLEEIRYEWIEYGFCSGHGVVVR